MLGGVVKMHFKPTRCDACGLVDPFGDVQLYEHDDNQICGACLDEALSECEEQAPFDHEHGYTRFSNP